MVQSSNVRLLIADFLVQQCIAHDDDVLEYIVESTTDETVNADALDELLASCAPATWGARELDSRLANLGGLLEQVTLIIRLLAPCSLLNPLWPRSSALECRWRSVSQKAMQS
jgi:hypothetical protein